MVRDLRDILIELFAAFHESHTRVVLCGGVALTLHGVVQATREIDLIADDATLVMSIVTGLGVGSLVDIFVEEPIPFNELWNDADTVQLGEIQLRIASLDHLIHMKRAAGRPHDLGDVDDLLSIKALRENEGRLRDTGGWDASRRYYHASCLVLSAEERLDLMLDLARLPESLRR
jgi:hypothetical protein